MPWGARKPRDCSQVFHKAKALNVAFTLEGAQTSQPSENTLASASGPLSPKTVFSFHFIPFETGL